jgi:hypothetical protein
MFFKGRHVGGAQEDGTTLKPFSPLYFSLGESHPATRYVIWFMWLNRYYI